MAEINVEDCGHPEKPDLAHMESHELRVIANFYRSFCGTNSFLGALAEARRLSPNGELESASIWNMIADEISLIETCAKPDAE
jgi:hypothetical protein